MPNRIQDDINESNRSRIGYISKTARVSVETQERRLEIEEVSRIYYTWAEIESNALRQGDTLFVYDLDILGNSRRNMDQRIAWLMNKGISIQLSSGRVAKLPPFKYQYPVHLAHTRAKSFLRRSQTSKGRKTKQKKGLKIKQPLSDRIWLSFYEKQRGELSHETMYMIAKRLGTDTGTYYKYLNRILLAIAKGEVKPPKDFPESLTNKVRRLRGIVFKNGEWIDLKIKNK